jgi:hypothetical protein
VHRSAILVVLLDVDAPLSTDGHMLIASSLSKILFFGFKTSLDRPSKDFMRS